MAERLTPGRTVALTLTPPDRSPEVRRAGRVVWTHTRHGAAFTVGVEFDRPLGDTELAALAFIGQDP